MSGSLLPNITYAAQDAPLYGAAGSGTVSTFGSPLNVGTGNFKVRTAINTGPDSATIAYVSAATSMVSQVFSQASPGVGQVGWFLQNGPSMVLSDRLYTPQISTANIEVSSINSAAYPPAGAVQSTIANSGTYINIPATATPVNFNLLNGASFTTPGNAGVLTLNGIISNNATTAANFSTGIQEGITAPIFNMIGANGVNCGLILVNNGVPQNVANNAVTANAVIHLTPVGASVTVPLSYTLNAGVGFTLYNNNATPVTIAYSIHSYDVTAA